MNRMRILCFTTLLLVTASVFAAKSGWATTTIPTAKLMTISSPESRRLTSGSRRKKSYDRNPLAPPGVPSSDSERHRHGSAPDRGRRRGPRPHPAPRPVARDRDRPPRQQGSPEPERHQGGRPPGLERLNGHADDGAVVRPPRSGSARRCRALPP